mgnify:CR=1 FL=1
MKLEGNLERSSEYSKKYYRTQGGKLPPVKREDNLRTVEQLEKENTYRSSYEGQHPSKQDIVKPREVESEFDNITENTNNSDHTSTKNIEETVEDLPELEEEIEEIFTVVEDMPTIASCDSLLTSSERKKCTEATLLKYIYDNLEHPNDGTQGLIVVSFVIDKRGQINDIKIVKGLSPKTNAAALKVIKNMTLKLDYQWPQQYEVYC